MQIGPEELDPLPDVLEVLMRLRGAADDAEDFVFLLQQEFR
jgi:hypothetical protein